jgi:hypothetical protein
MTIPFLHFKGTVMAVFQDHGAGATKSLNHTRVQAIFLRRVVKTGASLYPKRLAAGFRKSAF